MNQPDTHHRCRHCNVKLNEENLYPSNLKCYNYICKECSKGKNRLWSKTNPERARANWLLHSRKKGQQPMSTNKTCSSYLGVFIAERVIRNVFNHVETMPYGHPGYDFVCSSDKMVDAKSSCSNKNNRWLFHIERNIVADYFLCLAFDNREDLNPLHIWLLPGDMFNHLVSTSIQPSTIHKWDKYKLPIGKVVDCCEAMR